MMPFVLYGACVVSALEDPQSRFTPEEVQANAVDLTIACGYDRECIAIAAIIWRIEANFVDTDSGCCGPLQVIAVRSVTPTCAEMRRTAQGGIQGGWLMFEAKRAVAKRRSALDVLRRSFLYYNGHPKRRDGYSKRAMRLMGEIERACGKYAQ